MHRSTSRRVAGLALVVGLLIPGGVAAQSPVASAPPTPPPTPRPTDSSGIEWPPMAFAGGDPSLLVFTSTCGIWGQDPITLQGTGGAGSAELVVAFDTYDSEAAQWFGRVTGTTTGTNGYTAAVDEGAIIYHDFDLGRWVLVASVAGQIPAMACASASPGPSGGMGG